MSKFKSFTKGKSEKGFTLIEIMIVVAILGIISAVSIPSYLEFVRDGKRTDAKAELMRLAQMQESYFVQNLSYAKDLTSTRAAGGLGLGVSIESAQGEYTMSISSTTPANCDGLAAGIPCTGYTLSAQGIGSQANDSVCGNFTLTNTGQRNVSVAGHSDKCWK